MMAMLAVLVSVVAGTQDLAERWATRESGLYRDAEGPFFYGVGKAEGIKHPALRRVTALNRARMSLATAFETFSGDFAKAYMDATEDYGYIGAIVKGFSAAALVDVRVVA